MGGRAARGLLAAVVATSCLFPSASIDESLGNEGAATGGAAGSGDSGDSGDQGRTGGAGGTSGAGRAGEGGEGAEAGGGAGAHGGMGSGSGGEAIGGTATGGTATGGSSTGGEGGQGGDDVRPPGNGWPSWPMPNPPLAGLPHHASYDIGNDVVTDRVTGLEWQREHGSERTWDDAVSYCGDLELAGHTDWRLPTRIELISLIDFTRSGPAIDVVAFPGTAPGPYWTTSVRANDGTTRWIIQFSYGYSSLAGATESFPTRCVR